MSQIVSNSYLSSNPDFNVAGFALAGGAQVQSMSAILPLISNSETSGDFTYTGYALYGSADASAVWWIIRDQASTGKRRFASAPYTFDKVWNDRAGLAYS